MSEPSVVEVEASGETVGEARWAAVHELERRHPGLDRATVTYVVVSEGHRGLLGVGYEPARVVARAEVGEAVAEPAAPPAEEPADDPAGVARQVLERILAGLELDGSVEVEDRGDELVLTVHGPGLGLLIGKHGQTIDAVQYLVAAIVHRRFSEAPSVVVDAEGYRQRRERTLTDIALRAADTARRTGEPVALEPMTAAERKIVHNSLLSVAGVGTASEGAEPNRYIVVSPAEHGEDAGGA